MRGRAVAPHLRRGSREGERRGRYVRRGVARATTAEAWPLVSCRQHVSCRPHTPTAAAGAPTAHLEHGAGRQEVKHRAAVVGVGQQRERKAAALQRALKRAALLQDGARPQHKLLAAVLGARVTPHGLHAQHLLQHRAQVPVLEGG